MARLFDAVREGIYIGPLGDDDGSPLAANPYLKLMLGFTPEADASEVRPFARGRFVDPKARVLFVEQLSRDGAVTDYLLRLRRADESPIWVEVTANLDAPSNGSPAHVQALLRDVSERRRLEDQIATSISNCCRPRSSPPWARRSRAWPTSSTTRWRPS